MAIITENTYSEVYSYLETLGESFKKRLPNEEYEKIVKRKNNDYIPNYHIDDIEEDNKISKEAKSMIAMFHLRYWCDSDEEKSKIRTIFKNNEKILNEKYEVFKNKKVDSEKVEEISLVELKKDGIFQKIKNIFNNFIKKFGI